MSQPIDRGFSLYLDLARLISALIVMFGHAQVSRLISLPTNALLDLAPSAVIVFFVLSGFIIEATTDYEAGVRRYALHRTARIYSVAIPAVVLSVTLAVVYAAISRETDLRAFNQDWMQWWRLPVVLSFQAEDWFAVVEVPWNGPFWSLNYEVFYYALYGALVFAKGRLRLAMVLSIALLAGPKILLLLPCWWLGVEIARRPELRFPGKPLAQIVLLASPLVIVGLALSHVGLRIQAVLDELDPGFTAFDHSQLFLTDYVVAALTGAGFVAARQLSFGPDSLLVRYGRPLAWAAGSTFSIYLFHRPLQHLASKYFQIGSGNILQALLVQAAIVALIIALASVSEWRTAQWRRFLTDLFQPPARTA